MNPPAASNHGEMITRSWQRGKIRPFAAWGIRHFVCRDLDFSNATPADGVDLSIQHRDADGTPRTFKWRKRPPSVGCGVVLIHQIYCIGVAQRSEGADDVNFSVQRGRRSMCHSARQRRAVAPSVRRDVILLIELLIHDIAGGAADNIDFTTGGGDRYFADLNRHWRLH